MCIKAIIKIIILKWRNRGQNIRIAWSSRIGLSTVFEPMCQIHRNVSFNGKIGMGSYVGSYSQLDAQIGRFSSIAPHVVCNSGKHPYTLPFATTSPAFYSLNPLHSQCGSTFAKKQMLKEIGNVEGYSLKVGNDCWIGQGAFIVGGVSIADGAVVLAHAVVTKDVPPYAIVGGVPARIIRYRYDEETIAWLLKIQWWNNTKDWFQKHWELLCDIEKLKMFYKQNPHL